MPRHAEKRIVPYSAELLYSVVADVASYPQFLPWCGAARVFNDKDGRFDADLLISFKNFRERFTSRVTLEPNRRVHVDYLRGPMKELYTHWHFTPVDDNNCEIDFEVELAMRNPVLTMAITPMFGKATRKIMEAFEERAKALQDAAC